MNNKPRRGRPRGSTSFCRVGLKDLNNLLGEKATIVVSKKWLDELGILVEEKPKKLLTPTSDEPKIQFNVTH